MMKILQLVADKAYETSYFNITGTSLNRAIKFYNQAVTLKKVREFYNKNEIIKTFFHGLDKKDERIFMTETISQQFFAGDRVIRNKTKDRCILMVVTGEFFAVNDSYPNTGPLFKIGAVIGTE